MKLDFLIVGQGLAGSLLAWRLLQNGCSIKIVDPDLENASKAAAGLINPVTGMRFVKTENIEALYPEAIRLYSELGAFFQQRFFIEKPMLRLLRHQKEYDAAFNRLKQDDYAEYLNDIKPAYSGLNSPCGVLRQHKTGYLRVADLLSALKTYFVSRQCYLQTRLDYDEIQIGAAIAWRNIRAKKLVFCEGYLATQNPFFKDLPFQPVKGEILTLETPQRLRPEILNYGQWMIPLTSTMFKTGATFDRQSLDQEITEAARHQLINTLQKVYPELKEYHLVAQQAGVRPTTLDKRPFIGWHSEYPQIGVFNGFGSKGSLQIPFYSRHFIDHVSSGKPLDYSCDIKRL